MKKTFLILTVLLAGCTGTKAVYVPEGQAVRVRGTIKNAGVWVRTKDGDIAAAEMDLPDGWYCLPYNGGE